MTVVFLLLKNVRNVTNGNIVNVKIVFEIVQIAKSVYNVEISVCIRCFYTKEKLS